jgi:ABC-type molybdate transport system permease subunit
VETWVRWATELHKFQAYLTSRGIDRADVGIYGLARAWGLPGWMFLLGIPLGVATSWLVFRKEAASVDRYAAFAVSTVLMSPYTLGYDLAGLTFASVAMLLDAKRSPLTWLAAALIVSSVFANFGIVLLAARLSYEAVKESHRQASA